MLKIDLSGTWYFIQEFENEKEPISIPGDNYTALIKAGKILHPYEGTNENDVQWLGKKNWIFYRSFIVEEDFLKKRGIFLNIESLDTIAEVYINNHFVCFSDNMFIRQRIDITDNLFKGENEINIVFFSSEKIASERAKSLPYEVPYADRIITSKHRNLIRKVQCHSGWDWGPCLMVSGIYGDVYIGAVDQARIDYVHTSS
ncbi:MAG: hypothetical protein HeimC3_21960 [Candidatus Heimdallarchaeota archaeon LC_3]|nr:MAG: hypothetical protein HeimC3_21960 [Candidatus Heimdallarchaeota archaeon LC_3]